MTRSPGLQGVVDALRAILLLFLLVGGKDRFIQAMGGPDVVVGLGSATVQDLADSMEAALEHLTTPGNRVYKPQQNRDKFWNDVSSSIETE